MACSSWEACFLENTQEERVLRRHFGNWDSPDYLGTSTTTETSTPSATIDSDLSSPDTSTVDESERELENIIRTRIDELLQSLPNERRIGFLAEMLQKKLALVKPCVGTVNFPGDEATSMRNIQYKNLNPAFAIPSILTALSGFSIPAFEDIDLYVFCTNQQYSTFDLLLKKWSPTTFVPSQFVHVNWLQLPGGDHQDELPLWQHGEWDFADELEYFARLEEGDGLVNSTTWIQFPQCFESTPEVVVFVNGIGCSNDSDLRFHIYASQNTPSGCMLNFDTWESSTLRSIKISWIAYAISLAGVYSGSADTLAFRTVDEPQRYNMGYIAFPPGRFVKPPNVLVGLNYIDVDCEDDKNIKVFVANVTAVGMCWYASTWGDTALRGAGISYLAIEED
ncbi:hypothetical protein BJ508DRAFT_335304 [Ascobolus immersus RN42]|uniref:H-type lectin domain-containing protein n=1 Tax=Ascobolus immersus RN42 TaxID=1160509 RepID=A0A3N4HCW9_ASCIM|nr:hypothetical protein BJ508DRAFT_335304 [Ascobolus immersus RN42]